MGSPKEQYLYDSSTHLFHLIVDGSTLGRDGGDVNFPDDESLDSIHVRFTIDEKGVSLLDVSLRDERIRVNAYPIQKNVPRRLATGDVVAIGARSFILTSQNQYRPMPMASLTDKTMVRPTDETVLLPEASEPPAPSRATARAPAKSPTKPAKSIQSATSTPARESTPRDLSFLKRVIPAVIALGVVYLVLADPDGKVRSKFRSLAPAPKSPDLKWAEAPQPQYKAPSKPNRLALPKESGAVMVAGGGTGETYWEAFRFENAPDGALFIKNEGTLTKRAPFAAMRESDPVLTRFLALPTGGWNLPLGEQKEAEAAADAACALFSVRPNNLPVITIDQITHEVVTGVTDLAAELQDPRGGPLPEGLYSVRLATIRFPVMDGRVEIVSTPFFCADPAGQRIRFAQQRASLFHAVKTRAALANRLLRHQAERVKTLTTPGAVESLQSMRISSLIKGCRNLSKQAAAFAAWAPAPAWKEAGRQLSGYFVDDINELAKQYAIGEAVHPAYYPPIKPDVYLQSGDLLFLSAY